MVPEQLRHLGKKRMHNQHLRKTAPLKPSPVAPGMPTAAGVVAHAGAQAHLGHAPDVLGAARAEVPEASSVRSALRPARPGVSLPRRPVSTRPSDMGPLCRREDRMPYVIQQ